jgi:hypothetical protein
MIPDVDRQGRTCNQKAETIDNTHTLRRYFLNPSFKQLEVEGSNIDEQE